MKMKRLGEKLKGIEERLRGSENKILGIISALMIAGVGGMFLYNSRDVPEQALNFPQPNAEIVSYAFDPSTAGDVVSIDRDRSFMYDSVINPDGSVTYSGEINYRIRPYYRNRDEPDDLTDTRIGDVTVKGDQR